jgi:hypothetical protein
LKDKSKDINRVSRAGSLRDDANAGREGSRGFISSGDLKDSKGQARNYVSRCGSLRDDANRGRDA